MADPRHVPERRCLGCGARAPKASLARFVAVDVGEGVRRLVRDDPGRQAGRGLYVCPRRECFERARERRAFRRGARIHTALSVDPGLADAFDARERLKE